MSAIDTHHRHELPEHDEHEHEHAGGDLPHEHDEQGRAWWDGPTIESIRATRGGGSVLPDASSSQDASSPREKHFRDDPAHTATDYLPESRYGDPDAIRVHLAARDSATPRRPITLAHPAIFGGDLLRALKLDPAEARATRIVLDCDMKTVTVAVTRLVANDEGDALVRVIEKFELREVSG